MEPLIYLCVTSFITYLIYRIVEKKDFKLVNFTKGLLGIINLLSTGLSAFFGMILLGFMLDGFNPDEPNFGAPWWYLITKGNKFYYWSLVFSILIAGLAMLILAIDLYYREKKDF